MAIFEKGHKKTGGRSAGVPNKRTSLITDISSKYKMDPFEILMHFANGNWEALGYDAEVYHMETPTGETKMGYVITPNMRLMAAKEAVQYLYPKKKEEVVEDNSIEVMDLDQKKKFLEQVKEETKMLEFQIEEEENEL